MPNDAVTEVEARLELDRFLPYRLSVLSNRISEAIAQHYSERFALSPPEWRVMAALGNTPGLSAREVAVRTAMDKVQVSRAVASLVENGRVRRDVDGRDARVSRLKLSRRGETIYRQIAPLALEFEARLTASLSVSEREGLNAIIAKLAHQIDALGLSKII